MLVSVFYSFASLLLLSGNHYWIEELTKNKLRTSNSYTSQANGEGDSEEEEEAQKG